MGNPLWAPWRMEYILSPKSGAGCVFCGVDGAPAEERRQRLVVVTQARAFVVLNRYPFAAGHLLVAPIAHAATLDDLGDADGEALFRLVRASVTRLRRALSPEGVNVGMNIGSAAGAGIADHLHVHIVPRWLGDTNFMPVVADARVIPQALEATLDRLTPHFADLGEAGSTPSGGSG